MDRVYTGIIRDNVNLRESIKKDAERLRELLGQSRTFKQREDDEVEFSHILDDYKAIVQKLPSNKEDVLLGREKAEIDSALASLEELVIRYRLKMIDEKIKGLSDIANTLNNIKSKRSEQSKTGTESERKKIKQGQGIFYKSRDDLRSFIEDLLDRASPENQSEYIRDLRHRLGEIEEIDHRERIGDDIAYIQSLDADIKRVSILRNRIEALGQRSSSSYYEQQIEHINDSIEGRDARIREACERLSTYRGPLERLLEYSRIRQQGKNGEQRFIDSKYIEDKLFELDCTLREEGKTQQKDVAKRIKGRSLEKTSLRQTFHMADAFLRKREERFYEEGIGNKLVGICAKTARITAGLLATVLPVVAAAGAIGVYKGAIPVIIGAGAGLVVPAAFIGVMVVKEIVKSAKKFVDYRKDTKEQRKERAKNRRIERFKRRKSRIEDREARRGDREQRRALAKIAKAEARRAEEDERREACVAGRKEDIDYFMKTGGGVPKGKRNRNRNRKIIGATRGRGKTPFGNRFVKPRRRRKIPKNRIWNFGDPKITGYISGDGPGEPGDR